MEAVGLQRAMVGMGDRAYAERAGRAREAAEGLVSAALIEPVLKRLRESGGAAAPFAPNAAERSFRQMLDAEFAQRMVKSGRGGGGWPLVDKLAQDLLARGTGGGA